MTTRPRNQPNASGPFLAAFERCARVGAANADDAAVMASFCAELLQTLVGAASPQLVWEGAQRRGLTTQRLGAMCRDDPAAVHNLMWS